MKVDVSMKLKACVCAAVLSVVAFAAEKNSWHFSKDIPAGGVPQRARWDVDHKFDIPETGHVTFDFTCSNIEPCLHFTLHARKGANWISYSFTPDIVSGEKTQIVITQKDWNLKELPNGKLDDWKGFDGLRFSIWRAVDKAFSVKCSLENFTVHAEPAPAVPKRIAAKLPPRANERRLAWCHRAWGMSDKASWDYTIRKLKQSGFTDVIPNMCRPGGAYYESNVLPVMPYVKEHGDQVEACLKACRKYGVKCHIWKVSWYIGRPGVCVDGFVEKMREAGRLAIDTDGKDIRWMCPSHPENRKAEIDAMLELAAKGVDGIHFDFIRYRWMNMCYCNTCKSEFEKKYGAVPSWPKSVMLDGDYWSISDLQKKYMQFRCDNITAVVREVSKRVRKDYPNVSISAAVLKRGGETDKASMAQDWGLWCREKYLDFVCPMSYETSLPFFKRCIERERENAAGVKCYPGIGYSVMKPRQDKPAMLAEQVQALRDAGFEGFAVFDYTPVTATALYNMFKE